LLYGLEEWVRGKKEINKIHASEMRFLRAVKGCRKEDRIGNESIRDELQI
jgi:hypothetical protein